MVPCITNEKSWFWPTPFSELLSLSGFSLDKKPGLKGSRKSTVPSQQNPGPPWALVYIGSLLALQTPSPPPAQARAGGRWGGWAGRQVSIPHTEPLNTTSVLPFLVKPQTFPSEASLWSPYKISQMLRECYPPRHSKDRAGLPRPCVPSLSHQTVTRVSAPIHRCLLGGRHFVVGTLSPAL